MRMTRGPVVWLFEALLRSLDPIIPLFEFSAIRHCFRTRKTMRTSRNLQEITIIGEEDGQVNGAPTRSPVVAVPRPTTIRVCAPAQSDAIVATAEVMYRYEVEIDPSSGAPTEASWAVSPVGMSNVVHLENKYTNLTQSPLSIRATYLSLDGCSCLGRRGHC